jgi:hypothetical protein
VPRAVERRAHCGYRSREQRDSRLEFRRERVGQSVRAVVDRRATGAGKLYGLGQLHGLKEAVAYANSHGGMAGHPIQLILSDDGTDPTTPVNKLLSSNGAPDAVWAGSESDETGALLPVLAHQVRSCLLRAALGGEGINGRRVRALIWALNPRRGVGLARTASQRALLWH